MKIIKSNEFDEYWKSQITHEDDEKTGLVVKEIIADVRANGDKAVRKYASKFDKSSPEKLEVPVLQAKNALAHLRAGDPALVGALELSAQNIKCFCEKQKEQFFNFELEMSPGLFTGQRVIPVQRAAVYIPAGRFPLFSSVLMGMIPAFCAGVEEVILSSPPSEDGIPDRLTLAAAAVAADACGVSDNRFRIFAMGGAQAIAALALGCKADDGSDSVPKVDIITGPGNKYVAAAKRIMYGEVGIDFIAGPTDVLIIADGTTENSAELAAADMLAQAEHDPDARARALVPNREFAEKLAKAIEQRLAELPADNAGIARLSLDAGGLIIIYQDKKEAIRIANIIAPEHLELHTSDDIMDDNTWISRLKNYGSLFIGALSAEVLGDYSAGINHTLPTSTSARFTGGLSVRHFLKTVTTLRCKRGEGYKNAIKAAEIIGRAEGLEAHAQSAAVRKN